MIHSNFTRDTIPAIYVSQVTTINSFECRAPTEEIYVGPIPERITQTSLHDTIIC